MKRILFTVLATLTFATLAPLPAEEHLAGGQITVHHALSLDGAQRVLAAAEAHARAHGAPGGAIAVVDEGGHLLAFARLDGTFAGGANVAIGKARTSAMFRKPTRDFEEIINKGRFTMTALPDFTPLQGGVPIIHEGQVVGAIGVSGAKSAPQDEEIALAGAQAIHSKHLGKAAQ
jgi:uncharacterized protein GlcG (DUF336 family)